MQGELEREEDTEMHEMEKGICEAKAAVAQVKQCLEGLDAAAGGDTDVQVLQVLHVHVSCCLHPGI